MNNITAVVLTAGDKEFAYDGWDTLKWVSRFSTPEGLHAQRLEAIKGVTTPYFAYVDDDDTLPVNTADQMRRLTDKMAQANHAIGYTDCMVKEPFGPYTERTGEYKAVKHYTNIEYLHHLVVVRTADALALAKTLPRGSYWTEYLLYAPLARGGASYLPEVGYRWFRGLTGMHTHPEIGRAQRASLQWYLKNYPLHL